ncbi:MAG TPA: N-acetylmuramic acid 6-phosphate etherase [Acidobacteriota bacterium]|nr:N-acetylmuramic acid 6-phosphate etherase [Acidobacteriota bacterium]
MADFEKLIKQLQKLETEQVNPATADIDSLSSREIAHRINDQDGTVADVVNKALGPISRAAEIFADTLRSGGRVFYVGAGTSGRLGVLDAAECPPTFGTDPDRIIGIIAGGPAALILSIEGMEDNRDAAVIDLEKHGLTPSDFVIGICASRRTPYTLSALAYAATTGCRTAFIICNKGADLPVRPDVVIELPVGPEAITGSTRMKSGTAQKMALNMISTTAMVLLGKTYGNLMIDLQAKSEKLAARSRKILMDLYDLTLEKADDLLQRSGGSVKTAMVMQQLRCDRSTAVTKLQQAGGFVSRVK